MSVVMAGKHYQWHAGEKKIHKLLKVERGERDRAEAVTDFMPRQHMYFFAGLDYFVVATLDDKGRPWTSILTGERGFIRPVSPNHLAMVTEISEGDPVLETLSSGWTGAQGSRLLAGLGIDLTNRRRNKVAGVVSKDMLRIEGNELQMIVTTDESLGNCPKYITIRDIKYHKREAVIKYKVPEMTTGSLPKEALDTIEQCDTVFMAARHLAANPSEMDDVDVNHRGGKAGFVRVEEDGRTLILPDYSGNLFYQTLGSIESDRLAGLVFPNFITGDILYVTGDAENLYGEDANVIMPRTTLITRIKVTGYTYVQAGLNLISTKSLPSPYNPPLKYLTSELPKFGKLAPSEHREISLIQAKRESSTITTFTFELKEPVKYNPGQHAILDFSAENTNGYRHMADEAPQSINDDFIRSWTITSIPEIGVDGEYLPSTQFSCTIKNKYHGAVSPTLHRWAKYPSHAELSIKFIGFEGSFTCFHENHQLKENKLLFIAGGIGITPFMSMLEVARKRGVMSDVVLLFSARGDETSLGERFKEGGVNTRIFDTGRKEDVKGDAITRRIEYEDIAGVSELTSRGVYMCGPDAFMQVMRGYLEKAGVQAGNINIESFAF